MVTVIKKLTGSTHPFYEYACLSTDVKPVSLVPENSLCREIDTGKKFYFSDGAWHEAPGRGGGSSGGGGGDIEFVEIEMRQNEQTEELEFVLKSTLAAVYEEAQTKAVIGYCNVIDEGYAQTIHFPLLMATSAISEGVQRYDLQFGGELGEDAKSMTLIFEDSTIGSVEEEPGLPSGSNEGDLLVWDYDNSEWRVKSDPKAPLIVTLTAGQTAGQFVGDKTYKEVYDAFIAGKTVVVSITMTVEGNQYVTAYNVAGASYSESQGNVYYNVVYSVDSAQTQQGSANDYLTITMGS